MEFYNIHSMSVKDCQEMLMNQDYTKIVKSKGLYLFINTRSKRAYSEFIDTLNDLFSENDVKKYYNDVSLSFSLKIKLERLKALHEGLTACYKLRNNPDRTKILDKLRFHYRDYFHSYPDYVDPDESVDIIKKQIKTSLTPIENEIRKLSIKIKRIDQAIDSNQSECNDQDNIGLFNHIYFIESVTERNYDLNKSVFQLKKDYDLAEKKYRKMKAKNAMQ